MIISGNDLSGKNKLQATLDAWINNRQGGIALAWVDPRGTIFVQAGMYDAGDARPVTADTQFEIGSVTSVFTTLLLAESERLGKVNRYDGNSRKNQSARKRRLGLLPNRSGRVLVSTAFSLVTGAQSFLHRDRGWQPQGLVSTLVHVTYQWVLDEKKNPKVASQIRAKLNALPGIQDVSVSSGGPLYGGTSEGPVMIERAAPAVAGQEPRTANINADPAFFQSLHIPLREGRLFSNIFRRTDPPVAMVSASFAKHFWPEDHALGKRVRLGENQPWPKQRPTRGFPTDDARQTAAPLGVQPRQDKELG